jgi:cytochrome oxidase Cu insertion factor (SCO1/SenC/PrrC family)
MRVTALEVTRGAAAALLAAVLVAAAMAAPGGTAVLAGPAAAPAFSLELFNGQTLRLADLKGTAVVLLFWANW